MTDVFVPPNNKVDSIHIGDEFIELSTEDIQALEEWITYVKARRAKKRLSQRLSEAESHNRGRQERLQGRSRLGIKEDSNE